MKAIVKSVIFLFIFCSITPCLYAQFSVPKYEIGVGAGFFVYQGDLTPSRFGSYRTIRPAINLSLSRLLSPAFSLRTNLSFGALKGDDAKYANPAYRQQRNFNFRTPVFEVSELFVVNLANSNLSATGSRFSPYVFGGGGFTVLRIRPDASHFNSEFFASETSTLQGLAADEQHRLPRVIPVIPVGAGIKFFIKPAISLNVETAYRFTFTDYLDGFSKAANPSRKDSYQSYTVGLVYRFISNNTMKCPVF